MLNIKTCPYTPAVRIDSFYTAAEAVREVGFFFNGESHDTWECVFIIEGRAGVSAGETVYTLEEGQVILHPPREFHRIWNDGDIDLKIILLSFAASHFPISEHAIYSFPSKEGVYHTIEKLHSVYNMYNTRVEGPKEGVSPALIQLAVNELEKYLINLICRGVAITNPKFDKHSSLYTAALKTMRSNISHRRSVENIASSLGVSVSTLQNLFRRFTGMGVAKFYENIIMDRAHSMLQSGKSVKETAFELGYEDQNYFSTAFKRHFGVSPTKI